MVTIQDRQRMPVAWLSLLPVVHVLAFECGFLFERTYPLAAGCVSLLVVMGIMLALLWSSRKTFTDNVWDRNLRLIIGSLCALLVWSVITQSFSALESGFSRVGDTALLVGFALSLLLLRPDPQALLTTTGASVACITIISAIVTAAHGNFSPTGGLAFGLGVVPVLGCLATPVLAAWAINLWLRRKNVDAPSAREYLLCLAGIIALAVVVVATTRRGPMVAVGTIVGLMVYLYAWRRYPRSTLLGVLLFGAALVALIIPSLVTDPGTGRGERFLLYRVAWAIGVDGCPFGHGPFGMLAADTSSSADAMMWIAREKAALHAHNELLNAWVEGGVVQVGLVVMLGSLLALRIARCSNPVLKPAYIALGTAWVVHAMTDNTFGTPLGMAWSGVIYGAIMTLPQTMSHDVRPMPRAVLWLASGCGMLAIVTGWPAIGMAMLSKDTPIHARLTALEACRDPLFIQGEVGIIVSSPIADAPMKGLAVQMAENRIGWTANIPRAAVAALAAEGEQKKYVQALIRIAQRNPFDLDACRSIVESIRKWPDLADVVPEPIRDRCAALNGVVPQPETIMERDKPVVSRKSLSTAGAVLAGIQHALLTNTLTDTHRDQLLDLARHYGQIKHVAILAVQVSSVSSSSYCVQMMDHVDKIADGLGYPKAGRQALALAITKQHAENVLPIARKLFTATFDRLEKQEAPKFSYPKDRDERDTWQAIVRIWSLTRPVAFPERESLAPVGGL